MTPSEIRRLPLLENLLAWDKAYPQQWVRGILQASLRMVAALETGRVRLTEVNGISLADLDLDDLSDTPAVSKAATGG